LGEIDLGGIHPRANAAAALEHYARAIELAPNSSESHGARGAFYFFHGDQLLALTDLNRALELNPDDRSALLYRARALTELGDYDKALADLAVLSKSHPHWQPVTRVLGDVHLRKENWQAAVDAFTKVLERDPTSWFVFKRRALAYANLGQYPQALVDLKKALELNPGETSTLGYIPPRLVVACPDPSFRQGLLELAANAVDTSPNRPRALQDRAALCLGLSEWKQAQGDLRQALESDTANYDVHYQHALLCLMLKEAPQYRDACTAMVKKFGQSDDPLAVNFLAWTCALAPEAVEDYKPLVAYATKTVEARPGCDQFLNTLGAILYRAGRHEAAIEWLTELDRPQQHPAARADSSPAYIWYFLAMAHKKAGHDEQAREYLNKAKQRTEELAEKQDPLPWNRRATLELLRVEAETLLAAPAAAPEPSDQMGPQPTVDAELSLGGPYRWVLHVRRAGRFAAQGNWTEAASALSQATMLRPDDGELWRARGEAYEKLDQWDTALADYRKAMELKPQDWRSWQTRAENLAQSGQADKAIALFASLIEHNSDNAALWKARGEVHEKLDQWDAAVADYQKAMELDPQQRPLWKARAKQFAQSEQWDKAITLYTSLLQHSADSLELWQARAAAHAGLKQWDQAIADYGQVIQLKPDDVKGWRQRARAYDQLKAYDKAIADYSAIIQLKPDDPKAWGERAHAYFNLADYDKAIADHSQAIRLDPTNSWHYVGRAQAQSLKMENYDRALADCNEAIRVGPRNPWAYSARAEVHLKMENYDQALADCSQAIHVLPSTRFQPCPWAYVHRAGAHLAKRDYEQTVADSNEAIRLLPEYPCSYLLRAEAYLALRRYDDAVADSQKCAELEPADPTAALIRAQTLLVADRIEEYRQACVQILDRFGQSEDPAALCHAARACVLAPNAISDPLVPVRLGEQAVSLDSSECTLYTLGMAHLRAGEVEEAQRRFQESLQAAPSWEARFLNWLGLALVCRGRGETQPARQWLSEAIQLIEQHPARFTHDRIEGQLLAREAEQLLGKSEQKKQAAETGKEK
jgi:tetratricopeptide (TPR) repeat protein